jgi:hypothetical protein
MLNDITKQMLSQISQSDGDINSSQICYLVSDSFSTVEMYISVDNVSFRVSSEPYIVAMSKWLQLKIKNGDDITYLTLGTLVDSFEIPKLKYRSAMLILDLIEKINER